ncbi:UNVERIFIED_CONTAM: hypothetical protein FKN15_022037 [Acipenser sinensis]
MLLTMAKRESSSSPVVRQIDKQFLVCSICLDHYHNPKVMEFYCESCETAMCLECTEGEHREHVTVPLRDVLEQHKAALKNQLDAIRNRLPQLTAAIELVNEISKQLTESKNEAVSEISSTFEELERALHLRKSALISDLENICSTKQKVLQSQLASLLQGQENIQSSCSFTEQALSHGSATEVLLVRKQMSERVGSLARQDFPERPHENDHLDCVVETEGLRRSIQNLGVLITTSAVGHTSVATGEGLRHTLVGHQTSVTITTKDKDGELVKTGNAILHAEITAPDGSYTEAEVVDNKNGTYEVIYTLKSDGEFSLSLLLYNQPVRGSPFRLRSVKASDVIEPKIKNGQVFSNDGQFKLRFGVRGRSPGQLQRPTGVTVDMNGDIIVADYDNRWVSIFSSDGKFKVYSADGEFLFKFGSHGEGNGQFNAPTGVAVDANGNIIVADWGNSRIQVFDSAGSFLSYINTTADPLYGPQGLALTADGHVVVADSGNHCFKVYRYLQ